MHISLGSFPPPTPPGGPLAGPHPGGLVPAWGQPDGVLLAGPAASPLQPATSGPQRPGQPLHVRGLPVQGGAAGAGLCATELMDLLFFVQIANFTEVHARFRHGKATLFK